jgi:hypothetical protein
VAETAVLRGGDLGSRQQAGELGGSRGERTTNSRTSGGAATGLGDVLLEGSGMLRPLRHPHTIDIDEDTLVEAGEDGGGIFRFAIGVAAARRGVGTGGGVLLGDDLGMNDGAPRDSEADGTDRDRANIVGQLAQEDALELFLGGTVHGGQGQGVAHGVGGHALQGQEADTTLAEGLVPQGDVGAGWVSGHDNHRGVFTERSGGAGPCGGEHNGGNLGGSGGGRSRHIPGSTGLLA